ncbi:hypothetical protein GJ496_007876, partial [Pomphorhynchus laevis]
MKKSVTRRKNISAESQTGHESDIVSTAYERHNVACNKSRCDLWSTVTSNSKYMLAREFICGFCPFELHSGYARVRCLDQ